MRKTVVVSALLGLVAAAALAGTEETFDKTFDLRAGSVVTVSNVNGRITVNAWDQPRVKVHAVKKVQGSGDDAREALGELKIVVTQRDGSLSFETKHPEEGNFGFLEWIFGGHGNYSVTYELMVPRRSNLKIETVNGAVAVREVTGHLEAETTNGGVDMFRCAGKVDASTTNGAIAVELLQVDKGQSMQFETTNGSITLTVPPTLAADLKAETTNGSIKTELPITTRLFNRNSLAGTINGGGADVSLTTTNGRIEIKSTAAVK